MYLLKSHIYIYIYIHIYIYIYIYIYILNTIQIADTNGPIKKYIDNRYIYKYIIQSVIIVIIKQYFSLIEINIILF